MSNTNCPPPAITQKIIIDEVTTQCDPEPICIPPTIGKPTNIPGVGDSIWKVEACGDTVIFWGYTCDGGWQKETIDLCQLGPIDPGIILDICNRLRIPAFYDENGCCKQGSLSLNELAQEVQKCICESIQTDEEFATHAMVCGPGGIFIEKPLEPFPSICDLFSGVGENENPIVLPDEGTFTSINPATCELDTYQLPPPPDPCPTCPLVAMTSGEFGGGVCVIFDVPNGNAILESRTKSLVEGVGTVAPAGGAPGPLVMQIENPFTEPSVAIVDFSGTWSMSEDPTSYGDESIVWVISDILNEPIPYVDDFGAYANTSQTIDKAFIVKQLGGEEGPGRANAETEWTGTGSTAIRVFLNPLETRTFYGQWWLYLRTNVSGGALQLIHAQMTARWTIHRNAIII